FCTNDGVFGQCQSLSDSEFFTYQVSSSTLERLHLLLQTLAHRGLTWQDDLTQEVVSRELAKLHRVPLRRLAPLAPQAGALTAHRTPADRKQNSVENRPDVVDSDGRDPRPRPRPGWKTTYGLQEGKAQHPLTEGRYAQRGHLPPPPHTYLAPALQNSVQNSVQNSGRTGPGPLERLLAGIAAPHPDPPLSGRKQRPQGKLQYLGHVWSELPEPKTSRPNLDKLLLKTSSNKLQGKQSLSGVDDQYIHKLVNQLGLLDHQGLDHQGLDHQHPLADLFASLQAADPLGPRVGGKAPLGAPGSRGVPGGKRLPLVAMKMDPGQNQDQSLDWTGGQPGSQQGQQVSLSNQDADDKHTVFLSKLLHYLDREEVQRPWGDQTSWGDQRTVGLENVHSQTTLNQGHLPQKMKIKAELVHLGVKEFSSRGKDRHFGYIITDSDSLSSRRGSELMERLMEKLHLHTSDLRQLT
ncbi:hypothetical protein NHX12_021387, partial [Muraenolepis orangiensis]